jgi:NADH-quinone oxidoreductase subunit J
MGTVALRNPFYSVLALVCHLLSLAALFLLLRAEFLAAAQVIVYVGAVMVLYLFVVAYVGGGEDPIRAAGSPGLRRASALFAGALFAELAIAVLGTGLSALGEEGAGFFAGFGTPAEIGRLLLTDFLLAFEVASMLLLVAAVGAVILARRRTGLEDAREISVADLLRAGDRSGLPGTETGTLLEAEGPPNR